MKANEIRQKSERDLEKMKDDLQEELFRLKIKHATGQLEKNSSLRLVRKDLARVLTTLNERVQKA